MTTDGFLLVDKPPAWTSHDVVAKIRNLVGVKKVGHSGTLDPMATGLLVLGLGRATRLLRFIQELPKEYEARAQFGIATDSLDADGAEISRTSMVIERDDVVAILGGFTGSIEQVPPMVSAVKVGGRRLYELAREGATVERPSRQVEIHELEVTRFIPGEFPVVDFRTVCSSGTYVRTLADDIARALGGVAHLTALRRTRAGSLRVGEAASIDGLVAAPDSIRARLLGLAEGLVDMAYVTADTAVGARVAHGSVLDVEELAIDGTMRILDQGGRLLAIYRRHGDKVRPEVVVS